MDFNPLSPHGERRYISSIRLSRLYFNPLSPHGERRLVESMIILVKEFQSTLPAWGETGLPDTVDSRFLISIHSPRMGRDLHWLHYRTARPISIHSPRMGRDVQLPSRFCTLLYFNPLSPHGERRLKKPQSRVKMNFNPLSPHGERPSRRT